MKAVLILTNTINSLSVTEMIKVIFFLVALALSQADERIREPHPDCPASGHWLLPHEYDCEYFYYCENGMKFIEPTKCAPGTEFSATLQVCIHAALAGCELPGVPPTATEAPTTLAPTTTESTAAPTTTESTAAPTTAAPTTAAPTTAAPTTAAPTTAAPTTAAPTTAAPTTVAPTTAAPTTAATTTVAPTTAAPTTEAPDSEEDPCVDPNEIVVNCEEECNVLPWPHKDCDKFWMCIDGEAITRVCSEGLHFNPNTNTCDLICNVDCARGHIQTTSGDDGLRMFIPWDQIQSGTFDLMKLFVH